MFCSLFLKIIIMARFNNDLFSYEKMWNRIINDDDSSLVCVWLAWFQLMVNKTAFTKCSYKIGFYVFLMEKLNGKMHFWWSWFFAFNDCATYVNYVTLI